eukprot:TRINITY_DN3920_c1_g1_i6.p1 TRINITY_DN3920_c1_g1~~TRINITY_DN3920_c1_g1_i6.p1  ORF type:complete len:439 (+),score=42.02 TRINITY_DN3920_c1_g1_i6:83-1318(+)
MAPPNNTGAEDSSPAGSRDGEVESSGSGSVIADDEGAPAADSCISKQLLALLKSAHLCDSDAGCKTGCRSSRLAAVLDQARDILDWYAQPDDVKLAAGMLAIGENGAMIEGEEGSRLVELRSAALLKLNESFFAGTADTANLNDALAVLIAPMAGHGKSWCPADAIRDPRMAKALVLVRGLRHHALESNPDQFGAPRLTRWVACLLDALGEFIGVLPRSSAALERLVRIVWFLLDNDFTISPDAEKDAGQPIGDQVTTGGGALRALLCQDPYKKIPGKSLRFLTLALQNAECVNHHNAPNSVIPLGQLESWASSTALTKPARARWASVPRFPDCACTATLLTRRRTDSRIVQSKIVQSGSRPRGSCEEAGFTAARHPHSTILARSSMSMSERHVLSTAARTTCAAISVNSA